MLFFPISSVIAFLFIILFIEQSTYTAILMSKRKPNIYMKIVFFRCIYITYIYAYAYIEYVIVVLIYANIIPILLNWGKYCLHRVLTVLYIFSFTPSLCPACWKLITTRYNKIINIEWGINFPSTNSCSKYVLTNYKVRWKESF